jgi:hypothetical protein
MDEVYEDELYGKCILCATPVNRLGTLLQKCQLCQDFGFTRAGGTKRTPIPVSELKPEKMNRGEK